MKAMAQHSGAAQSLAEDDSLQLLFHMVAMGIPTKREKSPVEEETENKSPVKEETENKSPLHLAQLHRHVMQVFYNNNNNVIIV